MVFLTHTIKPFPPLSDLISLWHSDHCSLTGLLALPKHTTQAPAPGLSSKASNQMLFSLDINEPHSLTSLLKYKILRLPKVSAPLLAHLFTPLFSSIDHQCITF